MSPFFLLQMLFSKLVCTNRPSTTPKICLPARFFHLHTSKQLPLVAQVFLHLLKLGKKMRVDVAREGSCTRHLSIITSMAQCGKRAAKSNNSSRAFLFIKTHLNLQKPLNDHRILLVKFSLKIPCHWCG